MPRQHSLSLNSTSVASADWNTHAPSFGCTCRMVSTNQALSSFSLISSGQWGCQFRGMGKVSILSRISELRSQLPQYLRPILTSGLIQTSKQISPGEFYSKLIRYNSWTVITWVVVFGSTVVMLLWIVVYSFFITSDFIDEVVILFGTLTFWATVFLSAAVALGKHISLCQLTITQTSLAPRFVVKFFTTVYSPLDKDIVREMWVKGDLKDQLGINHRKARKFPRGSPRNLEAAPMFQEQHSRSLSELSGAHDQYEPTMMSSPGTSNRALRQTYLDTPPMSQATDLPIQGAQYAFATSHLNQETHLSPTSPGDRNMNPSPHPSYYSVSELPPPSPMPSPKYKYPSGEITSTPPSRRTSVATTRASIRGTPQAHAPMPLSPASHRPNSPNTLQLPGHQRQSLIGGTSSNTGAFEMRVRSPPNDHASNHSHGHAFERSASSASYTTAADDFYTAEDDSGSSYNHASGQRSPGYAYDVSSQQRHDTPLDDDDRDTIIGHDSRRHSNAASWEGPRAL